jgi:hypothetical protein
LVLNAGNGQVVRTVGQADLTRPTLPVPDGFRRVEVLTNEGRFWYQGIRFAAIHRTTPLTMQASYTWSKAEDWNLLSDGYVNTIGSATSGQHTGGSAVFPGRQFQFAATYRF